MENQQEKIFIKCTSCKTHKEQYKYFNSKGRRLKTCSKCRDNAKKQRDKNKCKHNRQKQQCKDCGTGYCKHNRLKKQCKDCGTGYCKHNRQKTQCKDCGTGYCQHNRQTRDCKQCGGTAICKHNKRKRDCKECSNPVKITIKRWLMDSKRTDKKNKKYDRINFIDKYFLNNLVEDIKNCIYCKVKLTYEGKRAPNLATIERINNNKGHIKTNCLLSCYKCNLTRSNRYTHEEFKYKFILKELLNKTKLIN